MNIADVVECRPETLKGEVEGIIYIERVEDPTAPESNPDWVFDHTCLLDDEKLIVNHMIHKLIGKDDRGSLLVLGDMGSGKSHELLLAYHIFRYPEKAENWLRSNGVKDIQIPPSLQSPIVAQMKQAGEKYRFLWDLIFEKLQSDLVGKITDHSPSKNTLEKVLRKIQANEKPLVIILDEIESWLQEIKDETDKEKNRFFLEKLAEIANDSKYKVLLIGAIRGDFPEPKRTLSRTSPVIVNLSASGQRMRVALFRLFKAIDRVKARQLVLPYVKSYVQHKDHGLLYTEEPEIEQEFLEWYPFHPIMLKVLSQRYSSHPTYHSTRGLLWSLASVVKDQFKSKDLFLLGDVSVKKYRGMLSMLDATLVRKAGDSIEEALEAKIPIGEEIITAIFFHSLGDREKGATQQDILFATYRPSLNPAEIEHSTISISEICTYIRPTDGRYLLGPENPESMVSKKAASVAYDEALGEIAGAIAERMGKGVDSLLLELKSERVEDKKDLKLVFSLKREGKDELFQEKFEQVLKGLEFQNSIVFLAPERAVDLAEDGELVLAAKRAYAARQLGSAEGVLTQQFQTIMRKKIDTIKSRIQGVDWNIIRWVKVGEGTFQIRPIVISGEKLTWSGIKIKLAETWAIELRDAIKNIVKDRGHTSVKKISDEFASLRGNPVVSDRAELLKTVADLCMKGDVAIEQKEKCYIKEEITVEFDAEILDPSLVRPAPEAPPFLEEPKLRLRLEAPLPSVKIEMEKAEAVPFVKGPSGTAAIITEVERALLEHGQLTDIQVSSPSVTIDFSLERVSDFRDLCNKMSPIGVRKLETNLIVTLSDMNAKELLEWLKKLPSAPGSVTVKGAVVK